MRKILSIIALSVSAFAAQAQIAVTTQSDSVVYKDIQPIIIDKVTGEAKVVPTMRPRVASNIEALPVDTIVDEQPQEPVIPLDTIIARNLSAIMQSLPEYKKDKFALTMVKMPLILDRFHSNVQKESVQLDTFDYARKALCLATKQDHGIQHELLVPKMTRNYEAYTALRYDYIVNRPDHKVVLAWKLPKFKKLEDVKVKEIVAIPAIAQPDIPVEVVELKKTHWLHLLDGSVQFSQAYLSPNWYQGGNNSLSLVANFLWDVKLNEVYHPNLLFENSVQYKLGLYSTPQDEFHHYSISEDNFQWNMKVGVKAFKKWFYSFTSQFKTQLLNTYPQNDMTRIASFLSPGDLNLGLGMTYSVSNKSKSLKFNASIAPISYNLKTCIDPVVDPTQFNIAPGKMMTTEIGSNAELTLDWTIAKNLNYRSRLFAFSNYKYFLSDWENTISFAFNKFLSTQIYVHVRYDSSAELSEQWRHWQLKEILSFGFQYKFSTKL